MAIVLGVYGCASDDGASTSDPDSAPSDPDHAQADDGLVPDEHLDDGQKLSTPLEDSAPFLEPDDDAKLLDPDGLPLPPLDPSEITQLTKCQRATGYRNGRKMTICVTTIDGKLVEVNTARAYLKMRAAAAKRGVSLYVVSGFRTMSQQRYLYNCYKTKRCNNGNLAAPPGYSNHQSGHALDLNTGARGVYSFLANHGGAYRFKRTVPSEAWHWEHW
jgi:hypothetical protein